MFRECLEGVVGMGVGSGTHESHIYRHVWNTVVPYLRRFPFFLIVRFLYQQ